MIKVEIKIPNKLSELTLGQYQKFSKIYTKDADQDFVQKKMIEIFCKIPLADVDKIKYSSIKKVINVITKMFNQQPKLKNIFNLDGVDYGFHPKLADMTFGEFVDADTFAGDWETMDKAMSVLYRPVKDNFKGSYLIEDYDGETKEFFKEMPLDVAFGAIFFFVEFKKRTHSTYPSLFSRRNEEKFDAKANFGSKWGWYSSFYSLAKEDVTKFEKIERLNLSTCLTWLSFVKEKSELEKQQIKNAKQGSSYR